MSFSLSQTLLLAIGALIVSLAFTSAIAQAPFPSDSVKGSGQTAIPPSQSATRLSLQAATDLLISNNLPVIAARYNVDILRAQRIAAGLHPNPTATFSATQFTIPRVFEHPGTAFKTNTDNGA